MNFQYILKFFLICAAVLIGQTSELKADIVFRSSTFQNLVVTQDDALGYAVTADINDGGVATGVLSASIEYGGGNNPFNDASDWGPSANAFRIFGRSTENFAGSDTADGFWNVSATANAGFAIGGISVYSQGSVLGNPDFTNLVSNGLVTISDSEDLITNYNDGDSFANGGDLLFAGGSHASGILSEDHSQNWAINAAGATSLSFNYQVGYDEPIAGVAIEGLWLDVQTIPVATIPEPNSAMLIAAMGLSAIGYRRRRS